MILQKDSQGQTLYCISCIRYSRVKGDDLHNYYLHAKDQAHAKLAFCRAYPNRNTHQIIAIAPAIGFFEAGKDKSGEVVRDVFTAD